jgi:hypothetical protein
MLWLGCARRFRPTYPDFLHGAPPTPACAAFIEEGRMKFANASELHRKSGVRFGERGAPPVRFPLTRRNLWVTVGVALRSGVKGRDNAPPA